jgi:oligoendopeptidase F
LINKPLQYSQLIYSTNTSGDYFKKLVSHAEDARGEVEKNTVFFDLEITNITDEVFEKLLRSPTLKNYNHLLEEKRKFKPYTLSEGEEQIIIQKDITGKKMFVRLYDEITSSFNFRISINGRKKIFTGSQIRALRLHPDPGVRAQAMKTFFSRYYRYGMILGNIYNSVIKDYNMELSLRGYTHPMEPRNLGNSLDKETVKTLIDVTTSSYPLVHRYYKLKEQLFNIPLTLNDIYAPIQKNEKRFKWDEAQEIILSSFSSFHNRFYSIARNFFKKRWIHARVQSGKRGGAYCSSSRPDIHPYVFMNFTGNVRDISTLAHELGHAIHFTLSSKQSILNMWPILPLAETASVFSEMILTDYFIKQETNKSAKLSLLSTKLEDIFATSHRQNMFTRFELEAHKKIAKENVPEKELSSLYNRELKLMFGDSVRIPTYFHWEWFSIPHIYHTPFYCYSYNFGNLLVIALYQQYLENGKDFIKGYINLLSEGNSKDPYTLLNKLNIDLRNPKFWEKSLEYIQYLVDQFEGLISS